jgi:tRNA pseudouridine13 synthase
MQPAARSGSTQQTDLPLATIRSTPEDFVVEELPAYTPSGRGEHLFITFRKTGKNTLDVLRDLARALGVDPRSAGYAGLKDRHAVTLQTVSLPFPIARPFEESVAAIALPGVEIVSAARHDNKLKPGHLAGNRFRIVLRGIPAEDITRVREKLLEVGRVGVPNAFGPQRFGRDGHNPSRALAWLRGEERPPRDKRQQRLIFSALQSLMFNEVLELRVADGTWKTVLPGDLARKTDSGGLFLVPAEGDALADAVARAESGAISATGPMFGASMRWPEGAPAKLERKVLQAALPDPQGLEKFRHLGEGTRRPLRLGVADLEVTGPDVSGGLAVSFVLPKGGYATTVLAAACRPVDASVQHEHREEEDGAEIQDPSDQA